MEVENAFKDAGYQIVRGFLDKEMVQFIKHYFFVRQGALDYTVDAQCPESKSFYADPLVETILMAGCKTISEITERELAPTYSYARIYAHGEELHIHRDRPACQYSATLALGKAADEKVWPIYFSENENKSKASEIILEEGDLCVYEGMDLYHWRNTFEGSWSIQGFLHYVDMNGPYANHKLDGRRTLGVKK